MSQNLVSLMLSNEDLAALDAALNTVEEKLAGLIELSVDQRRSLNKMGDKSEAFYRQALILLAESRQLIPPGLDLTEADQDLRSLDQLRPRFARLRRLAASADDTEMALGSDILDFALDGYAVAKVIGKGAALEAMKAAMSARYTRRRSEPRNPEPPPALATGAPAGAPAAQPGAPASRTTAQGAEPCLTSVAASRAGSL